MSKLICDEPVACRLCGCTEADCSFCMDRSGEPCAWAEPDLCTACEADPPTATEIAAYADLQAELAEME